MFQNRNAARRENIAVVVRKPRNKERPVISADPDRGELSARDEQGDGAAVAEPGAAIAAE